MTYKGLVDAHRGRIKLRFSKLSEEEAISFETRLNKYLDECGCTTGKIFLFSALALAVVYELLRGDISTSGIIRGIVVLAVAAVAGGAAGKVLGLSIANVRFRQTCAALQARLNGMA